MFVLGASGFVHELFTTGVERPFILSACLALMGLPFVLNGRKNGRGPDA
jgi:hypothetical protein